jgi:reactive chlorine resistance protein C
VLTATRTSPQRRVISPAAVTSIGIEISRYALAVIVGIIGLSKFTSGEASAIAPLIAHSPFLAWTSVFGVQATSNAIGSVEIVIALLLLARPVSARAGLLGAALAVGTFLTTSSFLLTTPHVFAFNGLAVLSDTGAFLIKDLGLLGASIVVLGEALSAITARVTR